MNKKKVVGLVAAALLSGTATMVNAAATDTSPQRVLVDAKVGGYLNWERVDGRSWSEDIVLKNSANGQDLGEVSLSTRITPSVANKKVQAKLFKALTMTNGTEVLDKFTLSLGGEELGTAYKTVVKDSEASLAGVIKELKVVPEAGIVTGKSGTYKGTAVIVMEGDV